MSLKEIFRGNPYFVTLSLIIITLFLALGTWQLYRLQEKNELVQKITRQFSEPAIKLEQLLQDTLPLEGHRFRKTRLTGVLEHEKLLFLQAQVHEGKLGVHPVVPLKLPQGTVVLISLGWIPKSQVSQFSLPDKEISVEGYLKTADKPNRFTPENHISQKQLYYINPAELAAGLNLPTLLPLYLVATHTSPLPSPVALHEATIHIQNVHLSYAVTWFSLAIAWLIMVWLYQRRKYLKRVDVPLLNELTETQKTDSK